MFSQQVATVNYYRANCLYFAIISLLCVSRLLLYPYTFVSSNFKQNKDGK